MKHFARSDRFLLIITMNWRKMTLTQIEGEDSEALQGRRLERKTIEGKIQHHCACNKGNLQESGYCAHCRQGEEEINLFPTHFAPGSSSTTKSPSRLSGFEATHFICFWRR